MSAIETLAEGPFRLDQIDVEWQPRPANTDANAAAYIEARWLIYQAEAEARGAHLFDAPAAHLLSWSVNAGRLRLILAPTDYKTFLVTTLRDRPWFQTHAPHAMTPVLGNSALLTYQHHALLGVRSAKVAAYPARAHLIGGVFDMISPPGAHETSHALQDHLLKEFAEELELSPARLAEPPLVLGLFRDPFLAQPELVWQAELAVEPAQWLARRQDDEHDHFRLLDLSDAHHEALTPCAAAAMRQWRSLRHSR